MITGNIIISTLYYFVYILYIFIIARILLSWFRVDRNNRFVAFLHTVTDPLLAPVKKLINKSIFGGEGYVIDFSPLIVIMILQAILTYISGF